MGRLSYAKPRVATANYRTIAVEPKQADAHYGTADHKAWAQIVCERAGYRCEHVEQGKRCWRSREKGYRMVADHINEIKDEGEKLDPKNGQCLCISHNTRKGIEARAKRTQQGA
jgi:hypothetical protein